MTQTYQPDEAIKFECNQQNYNKQRDLWAQHQENYQYKLAQAQLELDRQQVSLEQKLKFEKRLQKLKLQYQVYLQLMGSSVYQNSAGKIMYSLTDAEGKDIRAKALLNVDNYIPRFFVSYSPKMQAVLEISWGNEERNRICFAYGNEGITPQVFLKRLKSRGVMFLVSGRTEREAAKAPLAYSINGAEMIEIPFTHGWVKNKQGDWHFADNTELTLQEVLEDA